MLTIIKVSGSSVGVYHDFFYGKSKDSSLILNKPRPIRTDEWLMNTQLTNAQSNNNFDKTNQYIGDGVDMSLIVDVPYREWSIVFKPQNWSFFALPFNLAFAFKWWFMGYLLILSCYFFFLALLPKKILLAVFFSLTLFFSPFIQWWYQYFTLAPIYLGLFMAICFMYIIRSKTVKRQIILGSIFSYFLVSFVLVLYPPFQIACAVPLGLFMLGFALEQYKKTDRKQLARGLIICGVAVLVAVILVFSFVATRKSTIDTIQNTAYPGKRIVKSGGFDAPHLLSSHLAFQFQFTDKAERYKIADKGIFNQSETSNFILLIPYLFLPGLFLLYKTYRHKKTFDWPLALVSLGFVIILIRLFVPYFNTIFRLLLFDKVPHKRFIIGLGLLGAIHTILFIRNLYGWKRFPIKSVYIWVYCAFVFLICIMLGLHAKSSFPGFIGNLKVCLFAVPLPIIVFLLLKKKFVLGVGFLLIFSIASTVVIHPLYRSLDIVRATPLSHAIQEISSENNARWISENIILENFALTNGAHSLSGVYAYPQLQLWKPLDKDNSQEDTYNRYAHVIFDIDRNPAIEVKTRLELLGGDNFKVVSEPCSEFLRTNDVHYILSENTINDSCLKLVKTVKYPARQFNIYEIKPIY